MSNKLTLILKTDNSYYKKEFTLQEPAGNDLEPSVRSQVKDLNKVFRELGSALTSANYSWVALEALHWKHTLEPEFNRYEKEENFRYKYFD